MKHVFYLCINYVDWPPGVAFLKLAFLVYFLCAIETVRFSGATITVGRIACQIWLAGVLEVE